MRPDEDTLYRRLAGDPPPARVLTGEMATDTLVIGGGLAGLTTALSLAERGQAVTLLEARRVGFGASGRNGGILGYGYPLEWDEIEGRLGLADARSFLRLGQAGQAAVKERIRRYAIDCGPHPDGYFCGAWHDRPQAGRDYVARQNERFGLDLRWLGREEAAALARSPRYHGGFFDPAVSQIQPLLYCRGLARALAERGGELFEDSPALALERQGAGWRVRSAGGSVTAGRLVLCGGGYIGRLHPAIGRACIGVATHIAATRPLGAERLARAIPRSLALGDDRQAGAYYRALADGRLVWGGRLTLPWERGSGGTAQKIRRWIESTYPQLGAVEMEVGWHGLMSFGRSRMVQLGQLPDGVWYAFGFGGSGLASTAVAGHLLATAIAEGDDEWRRFAPFGLGWMGGALGNAAARVVYSGYRLADWAGDRREAVKRITARRRRAA
jgi:glycine/D-amino acid oxidase-like deaminating enzyme